MPTSKHILVLDLDGVLLPYTGAGALDDHALADYHAGTIVTYTLPSGQQYRVPLDLVDYLKVESNRRTILLLSSWKLDDQAKLLDMLGLSNIHRLSVDRSVHNNDPQWFTKHKELPLYQSRIFQGADKVIWVDDDIQQRSENLPHVTYVATHLNVGITASQLKRTVHNAFQG